MESVLLHGTTAATWAQGNAINELLQSFHIVVTEELTHGGTVGSVDLMDDARALREWSGAFDVCVTSLRKDRRPVKLVEERVVRMAEGCHARKGVSRCH